MQAAERQIASDKQRARREDRAPDSLNGAEPRDQRRCDNRGEPSLQARRRSVSRSTDPNIVVRRAVGQEIECFDRPAYHDRQGNPPHRLARGFDLVLRKGLRGPARLHVGHFDHLALPSAALFLVAKHQGIIPYSF
jgi:hypothetical protein